MMAIFFRNKGNLKSVLILILSKDLKLRFISPDTTAPFRPHPAHLDCPIEAAEGLMAVDPSLSLDCRLALQGKPAALRKISSSAGDGYLRRIMLRTTVDGPTEELVVSYEASVATLRLELAQFRKQLVNVLDPVQDPFAYYDKYDCLVLYNQAYARLHEHGEEKIIAGMRFEEILRRDLRNGLIGIPMEQHEKWLRNRLAQRECQTFEKEMRLCDGRWFRVSERSIAGGSRVNLLVDITDLKTSQVALQQVISGAQAATWTLNLDTGESDVNDRWAEMLGFDRQAVNSIGFEGWRLLVHPDDIASAEAGFLQCAEGSSTAFEVEYRLRHKFGHWVWVMGRGGVSDYHADGRASRISGVLLDISRQKILEAELAMQSAAISATEEGITITNGAGTILYTNPAHAAMFGYACSEALTGQPWQKLYEPKVAAELAADAFPELREQGYWTGQAEALRADGRTFEQELSLTEMPDGKIICINRDVSARNAIAHERFEIRERVEMAQRQEIVNLLAAGLTHDLTNLIMIISYVSDPALDQSVARLRKALKTIHIAARQAVSLLEPMRHLAVGKREAEEADLTEILREAAGILKLGTSSNVKIKTDHPVTPIIAQVDPLKLMQVLLNLGLNGRDSLGDGEHEVALSLSLNGTVPQTAAFEVGKIPGRPYALFKISDTGTGITPDVRARLWEPHFTTKGSMGTGLGLPVIAEIVIESGGGIALETAPGVGSSFYVAWPLTYPVALERRHG